MKRILVALDGSERARGVLDAATRLAQLTSARLVLFRAIGLPPDLPRDLLQASPTQLEASLRKAAIAELEQLAADLPAGLVESTSTELAIPWDGIVREARRVDADLIAIGSHGYSVLDRVLGTTAAKVVNHADRNVLIVRSRL
jgi:universal stress protein F